MFACAVAGLGISGYLLQAYVSNEPVVCGTDAGCEVVRLSQYAKMWGVPTPAYGVLFYAVLAIAAIAMPAAWPRARLPLMATTLAGILVSAWLSYIEAFVLESWCRWCVASAIISILTFVITWFIIPNYDD